MINKLLLPFLIVALPFMAGAQSYNYGLEQWRNGYKMSLLSGSHPLKAADTAYLRFYAPDEDYRVKATFVPVHGARPFQLNTMHGGANLPVKEYGYVYFNLMGAALTLHIYMILNTNSDKYDKLFIPFTDQTNYKKTFLGGRYLDVSVNDIKDDKLFIDFNKCYNPHTAYEKGYPYAIPPKANSIRIEIKAGEKIFGNNPGY
jgi:uncharacterized protein (DUF1684 family)